MTLGTQPPKGTKDRYPDEMRVRTYIFDTWRRVCQSFGYEEYLAPLVEHAAVYEAKSGEDVGGSELTRLTDRDGVVSDLALRPEMTPSVTRMVASQYRQLPKPIRWFSIANFYRNERPQRGRNREFWQLNVDMFGPTELPGTIEILQLSMELMRAFNPPADSRSLTLNHRGLINAVLGSIDITDELATQCVRTMDKRDKLPHDVFEQQLSDAGLDTDQVPVVVGLMSCASLEECIFQFEVLSGHESVIELQTVIRQLQELGYHELRFSPSLMRGFDYYDGIVFEVFDHHPDNSRALFGGGRYDGLADIFGSKDNIQAIGFAPGDETMKLFLEARDLLDHIQLTTDRYLVVRDEGLDGLSQYVVNDLRSQGYIVQRQLTVIKRAKAFAYAEKQGYTHVVLVGDEVQLKELATGDMTVLQYDM